MMVDPHQITKQRRKMINNFEMLMEYFRHLKNHVTIVKTRTTSPRIAMMDIRMLDAFNAVFLATWQQNVQDEKTT